MIIEDTICAIATGSGSGAIAVIRVSGKDTLIIADEIFESVKAGKRLSEQKGNTIHFGNIVDEEGIIDEVLISVFKNPYSFTGEDSVEISCHASKYIQQRIVQALLKNGCRFATPGEFTQRAFLNGKMDLAQAEAVADLIASGSKASHALALNQMRGGFSDELRNLRVELLNFTALIELELDFSEEDVEFADRTQLNELANRLERMIRKLADSFKLGNSIKNGIPVAIIGETNVGKSTLLNALLNEDKAIVSDIHGTTRDVIEDTMNLQGVMFRFIDTAGIRSTEDTIENLGIERTYQKLEKANVVLLVVDSEQDLSLIHDKIEELGPRVAGKRMVVVFNKVDNISDAKFQELRNIDIEADFDAVFISAQKKENLQELEDILVESANMSAIEENDVVVTNIRHYEALVNALEAIERVQQGLANSISSDFLSQDIRGCMHYLGEITGEISTDDVLGHIFAHFCIGK